MAEAPTPFSEFQNLTPSQLATVQGKLTNVGSNTKMIPTLAFYVRGHALDLGVFRPFYRQGSHYAGDWSRASSFCVTGSELKALIDSLAPNPSVTDGGVHGYLSFSFSVMKNGRPEVFETVMDTTGARLLFRALFEVLLHNPHATQMVTEHACMLGYLPGPFMVDVSSQVSIQPLEFRKDVTGQYSGRVRVANTSGRSIPLPIILVFRPPENMTLVSGAGFTCELFPSGAPYQALPITRPLAPGQHLNLPLRFENPDEDPIELLFPNVYSGPGFR